MGNWQHLFPGRPRGQQAEKTAMPEINTGPPALQKPRFCRGVENASYPLWKSGELTMTGSFSFSVVVRTV